MSDLEKELNPEMIEFLDQLVANGPYRDRGDALRQILDAVMKGAKKSKGSTDDNSTEDKDTGGEVIIQLKKKL